MAFGAGGGGIHGPKGRSSRGEYEEEKPRVYDERLNLASDELKNLANKVTSDIEGEHMKEPLKRASRGEIEALKTDLGLEVRSYRGSAVGTEFLETEKGYQLKGTDISLGAEKAILVGNLINFITNKINKFRSGEDFIFSSGNDGSFMVRYGSLHLDSGSSYDSASTAILGKKNFQEWFSTDEDRASFVKYLNEKFPAPTE